MKKQELNLHLYGWKSKILRVMRLIVIMMLFPALLFAKDVFSQKQIRMEVKDATLEQVLKELRSLSGYYILYNIQDVRDVKGVNLKVESGTVEEILTLCLRNTNLNYEISDQTILISVKKSVKDIQQKKEREIRGIVKDEKGELLPGAVIFLKSNPQRGVATDTAGRFTIRIEEGSPESLVVRFVGMESQVIPVTEKSEYVIVMRESVEEVGEVVVTGYQTISKERATGSFNILNANEIERRHVTNLSQALDGLIAGMSGNSDGRGGKYYQIRGISTMQADRKPLIVVDGFPLADIDNLGSSDLTAFEKINPNDVESITVLKDAAAASIWGARSANGVIVITTKRGKKKEGVNVNVSAQTSIAQKYKLNQILTRASSADHVAYERMAMEKGWMDGEFTGSIYELQSPMTKASEILYQGLRFGQLTEAQMNAKLDSLSRQDNGKQITDYLLENAMVTQVNLSLSTGGDRSRTYASFMYQTDRDGFKRSGTDQYMLNFNNVYDLHPRVGLTLGATLQYMENANSGATLTEVGELSPYEMLLDENGDYASQVRKYNPIVVGMLPVEDFAYEDFSYNLLREVRNRDYSTENIALRAQIGLNVKLVEGLELDGKFQYERSTYERKDYSNEETFFVRDIVNEYTEYTDGVVGESAIPKGGILQTGNGKSESFVVRGGFNFNRTFKDVHSISAVLGTEFSNYYVKSKSNPYLYGYNRSRLSSGKLLSTKAMTLSGWESTIPGTSTTMTWRNNRYVSFYVNASYTYDDKYTLSASARSDASNLITDKAKYRWSPLWSIGGAWNMHREDFMQEASFLDRLVVRLTYGQNGNSNSASSMKTTIGMNSSMPSEETGENPAYIEDYGNPTLRWEKTNTTNFGVDFSLWSGKLFGTLDFYNKAGKDILGSVSVASAHGTSTAVFNNAELTNRGVEVTLGTAWSPSNGSFMINSVLTYAYNSNKVKRLYVTPSSVGDLLFASYVEGKPMDAIYSYRYMGMEDGQPMISNGLGGKVSMADYSVSSSTNYDALKYHGSGISPHTLGWSNSFSLYDFNLSIMLQGKLGGKFRNPVFNYPVVNSWTKTSVNRFVTDVLAGKEDVPSLPGEADSGYAGWGTYSNYLDTRIESASYIYCKEITLEYNLPERYLVKTVLSGMGAFVKLDNVGLVWSKNSMHYHPEFLPGTIAPTLTWMFGLNVKF